MNNFTQGQILVLFFVIGVIIGIIFDIFRSIRKNFNSNDIITLIQDIIFLVIATIIVTFSIIKINNGIIRLYIFIGILIGIYVYFLTLSNYCVIILTMFVKIFKIILKFPINSFIYIVNVCKQLKKKDF